MAWVPLPVRPECLPAASRAACSPLCGRPRLLPGTAACHGVSALGGAPCLAGQEEAGLRGSSVSCCLCPPGCWADCALTGKIGVWRPPLGLGEQWEACQAGPKWPWGQIPSPWCRGAFCRGLPSGPSAATTPALGSRPRQAAVRGPGPGRPPWSRLAVLPHRAAVQRVVTAMNQMDQKKHEKFANQFNYALN